MRNKRRLDERLFDLDQHHRSIQPTDVEELYENLREVIEILGDMYMANNHPTHKGTE